MATGDRVVAYGTLKTLESNGTAITNTSVVAAATTYSVSADGGGYPDGEFVLIGSFGATPTQNSTLVLMARPLDIDGTNDAEIPEMNRPTVYIGRFVVNDVSTQAMPLNGIVARDLPALASYYIGNDGTGQTLSTGWRLTVLPRTERISA